MKYNFIFISVFTLFFAISGFGQKPYYNKAEIDWAAELPPTDKQPKYSIYLIGDAGQADFTKPSALKLLQSQLQNTGTESSVVFLGDNIYPDGLPDTNTTHRKQSEARINAQMDILKNYKGKAIFIPGNHDWDRWRKSGLVGIRREEKYIEESLNKGNVFLPDNGCPGPVRLELTDNLILVVIDTQWWLHSWDKARGEDDGCSVSNEIEFMSELKKLLANNSKKQVIIVGHHPIFSNGNHGGYFHVNDHLFPLTVINPGLKIPLPVIGSIYPFSRKLLPHKQDIGHLKYQLLKKKLLDAFEGYDNLVYAAGHEHNLQYFNFNNKHYLVSGSGSKVRYAARGHKALFTYARQGFIKLDYYTDGELWMETWVVSEDNEFKGELVYRKMLVRPTVEETAEDQDAHIDYTDSTLTVVAGPDYEASKFKTFFFGKHYRNAWLTPVNVPLIDLEKEQGGLTPIKLGGGFQTKALRLKDNIDKEYVFRSIQKYPRIILPEEMRQTWIGDIFQDQISMAHPYGAFVIAPLAEAINIYHKNPKLVYVPDDPRLQDFRDIYKNTLALYEERASKNLSGYQNFGNADKAISTTNLLIKLREDNDNVLDEMSLLKNRLFDIWIGDWDRHDDQWRWAKFGCGRKQHDKCYHVKDEASGTGQVYQPIPRDRDQVFVKLDGVFPWIARRKWAARKLAHFDYTIRDMEGLNLNGRHVDRTFLTRPSKAMWIETAAQMQQSLTDEVIEEAFKLWPDTIYKLDGEEIIAKLKFRRDQLKEFAERYYLILAKEVNITGSDMPEIFEVTRKPGGNTLVQVYRTTGTGAKGHILYQREFNYDETEEIRLYGFGGDDRFHLSGEGKKGILISVIGGLGNDVIRDESNVKGWGKLTRIYDNKNENTIETGKEAKDLTSGDIHINDYNRKAFEYGFVAPRILFGFNVDDGVFLGGGICSIKHGFRKDPHASDQKLVGSIATATGAFNFYYEGNFIGVIKKWNLNLDLTVLAPNSVTNYFGLGNLTKRFNIDRSFYLVRYNEIRFSPSFNRKIGRMQIIKIGTQYQFIDIEQTPDRFISDVQAQLPNAVFNPTHYTAITFDYTVKKVDNEIIPSSGFFWVTSGSWNFRTDNTMSNFSRLKSDVRLYLPLNLPLKTVLALRLGGATIFDTFEFYQANTLGAQAKGIGYGNLRGFRRDRFSGRTSVYQNIDLRIKLFNFRTYLFPGQFGILGFLDHGRVWVDNEKSNKWHKGYGGGIWLSPFHEVVLTAVYQISEENNLFNFNIGFLF